MVLLPLVPEFQFHKGAIRTLVDRTPCTLDSYFNSIKVRLEQDLGQKENVATRFQFHKGAIRTAE